MCLRGSNNIYYMCFELVIVRNLYMVICFDWNFKKMICPIIKPPCTSRGFIDGTHLTGYMVWTIKTHLTRYMVRTVIWILTSNQIGSRNPPQQIYGENFSNPFHRGINDANYYIYWLDIRYMFYFILAIIWYMFLICSILFKLTVYD